MISIITPVLNGAKFIEKNIQSIHKLTIPFEHIIVDGGSTDATLEIVHKYPHLILLHQTEKNGMYGAIDMGFKQAKGEYIGWVNCDDIIIPDNFGQMYLYAEKHNYDFVNSDSTFFYIHENRIEEVKGSRFSKFFLRRGILPFVQPSSLYKKSLYNRVYGFNTDMKIASDMDLFYRMSRCENTSFGYFPIETTKFIKHGHSLGDLNSETAYKERIMVNIPNPSIVIRFLYKLSKTI